MTKSLELVTKFLNILEFSEQRSLDLMIKSLKILNSATKKPWKFWIQWAKGLESSEFSDQKSLNSTDDQRSLKVAVVWIKKSR